ncbi:MAG: efflux RND transporter periplasmic adaptor subunit [Bacteroidaceae bacterium]|nr:efflux RND transporter periplasmic adaptor subunit [Bacteroidaceae bacterium]
MDIQLKEKAWYVKYRFHIAGAVALFLLLAYMLVIALSPSRQRVSATSVRVAEVQEGDFVEYVNSDGVLYPIRTHRINAKEGGMVQRVVADNGAMVRKGDTILLLANPELERNIDDMRDTYHKSVNNYKERIIEMEQKSLTLQQQTLQTAYELRRLEKQYNLDCEEFRMGIKSKAELEVSQDEYNYRKTAAELQMKSLVQDSAMNVIRREMLDADLATEQKKLWRSSERLRDLIIFATADGQLSNLSVTSGKQVGAGEELCEIKVLDSYKLQLNVSEYYIDRITTGQAATVNYGGSTYNLFVSRVIPEVNNGTFTVEMLFADSVPQNARVGKSYLTKIELGSATTALLLPKGDFYVKTAGKWIYKLCDDGRRAVQVPLELGLQNPMYYEVRSGLSAGDKVIVAGYDIIGDAEEIIIEND